MMKCILILIFSGLFCVSAYARTADLLSQTDTAEFRQIHQNLIHMMIELDGTHSQTSATYKTVQGIWNFVMSKAYADQDDRCFYGGWISFEKDGECLAPWKARKNEIFANEFAGHLYTSEVSCGKDELMRCNPLLFGASSTEGGKCVNISPSSELTKRCSEASRELSSEHLELLKNDDSSREKYAKLLDTVMDYCQEDKGTNCYHLAGQVKTTLDQVAAQGSPFLCADLVDPIVDTENFKNLLNVLDTPPKIVTEKWAAPIQPDFQEACKIEGMSEKAQENCLKIFMQGSVPKNALLFALDGLKRNANEFKTNKCFDKAKGFDQIFDHYSTPKEGNKEDFTATLENGIQNKCTMIINDYDDRIVTHGKNIKCKTRMYYIDLCKDEPKVVRDYSYVGYGTCKNSKGFENKIDQGTTLLGFSVTSSEAFAFAKSDASYNSIRKNLGGRIPSVALFGLQNSNNRSSTDYKYLHVGAYTSAGCPSIDPSNAWMVDQMASAGPSVVVGYKEGEMESFDKCGDE